MGCCSSKEEEERQPRRSRSHRHRHGSHRVERESRSNRERDHHQARPQQSIPLQELGSSGQGNTSAQPSGTPGGIQQPQTSRTASNPSTHPDIIVIEEDEDKGKSSRRKHGGKSNGGRQHGESSRRGHSDHHEPAFSDISVDSDEIVVTQPISAERLEKLKREGVQEYKKRGH